MKKFYTYVLVSLIIFASLSVSPAIVKADDGVGPEITKIQIDNERVTRGQKVNLQLFASDRDGLASTGSLEIITPGGDKKTIQLSLNDNYYIYTFNLSETWEYTEFGTYKFVSASLYDRYGNISKINLENYNSHFELYVDNEGPVVTEVDISRSSIFAGSFEDLNFTVKFKDEGKASRHGTLYMKHVKSGQEKPVYLSNYENENVYIGFGDGWDWYDASFGEWVIDRIELSDVAGNQNTSYGPYTGRNSLKVLNLTDDKENPKYISSYFEKDTQIYTVNAKDNSYLSEVKAIIKHRRTGREIELSSDPQTFNHPYSSAIEMSIPLLFTLEYDSKIRSGFWDVIKVEITDRNQNITVISDIKDSIYIEPYIGDLGVRVIQGNETLSSQRINQDVFIMPGAILSTFPSVTMTKNLYVLGALRTYGGLFVDGTVYGNRMTLGHSTPIYNGDIQISGNNYLFNTHVSNLSHFILPINTGGALAENEDKTFDIIGLTLPLSNKISINGIETELDTTGRFKALNVPMNEKTTADVSVTATNGVIYSTSLKVYDKHKPVVTASKDSGIYLAGTNLNIVSTREGAVYYNFSPGAGPSDLYTTFPTDFVLNNDVNIKYYSVDPAGIESDVEEKKYRVFSVYSSKASESFIRGSGSPGLKIQVEIDGKIYTTTINSEGRFLIEGLDLTKSKQIQVFATDEEFTSESYTIDVIDDLPIVVEGAKHNQFYTHDITITYNKGKLYRGRDIFVPSGTTFSEEGLYELYGIQPDNNWVFLNFAIDKTPPQVSDIQTGKAYSEAVYPMFIEGTATLNGVKYTSGTKIDQEGEYVLIVTDQAGNNTTLYFTIDYKAPIVSGVENGKIYNQYVTPTFNEGTAKLNGSSFTSGTVIKTEGAYELIVQDLAGNTTTYKFEIDITAPKVTNVSDGATYRRAVIYFNDGVAKLNGTQIQTNHEVTKDGKYDLVVTDRAGNVTKLSFEVDSIAPIVSGVESGKRYNGTVTPTFTEGVGKLNGKSFTSGTAVQTEGSYELSVQDKAGNTTITTFIIDLTAPVISGVQTNTQYTQPVVISFNEGSATLNGKAIAKNYTVDKDGSYELKVKDSAGNETIITFELDQLAPVVTGVEAKAYRQHVTPVFVEGTGTLNGKPYVSGTMITTDGEYELTVSDRAGNKTVVRFKVDQNPVTVTGVESGKIYQRVTPLFSEGYAVLNGVPLKSGTVINQSGAYVLLVRDEAGNETKLTFIVDGTAPTVTGFIEGINNYQEVSPTFTEGTGTLNGKPFVSSTKVMQEGKYVLRVTDQIGNETVIPFTIDRTAPIVTGVKNKQLTNQSVVIKYNEGTATLNGKRILNNWSVKTTGNYTLRITDQAGNLTVLTFTIDKVVPSKPTISTLTNKSTKVTGKAEKGSTVSITYNGRTYTTKASTAGTYSYSLKTTKAGATVTVRAKDAAGNLSTAASSKVLNTFATFTVNTVKSSAISLTGKGNKAATVQAFVGTKAISKVAKVDSKGNYKLTIPRQKAGVTVSVKMIQSGYQELKKTTKVIK